MTSGWIGSRDAAVPPYPNSNRRTVSYAIRTLLLFLVPTKNRNAIRGSCSLFVRVPSRTDLEVYYVLRESGLRPTATPFHPCRPSYSSTLEETMTMDGKVRQGPSLPLRQLNVSFLRSISSSGLGRNFDGTSKRTTVARSTMQSCNQNSNSSAGCYSRPQRERFAFANP